MSRRRGRRRESGQGTIEFVAWIPFVVLAFLMCLQGFTYFWVTEQVTSAARNGARVEGEGGNGHAAASDALSDGVRQKANIRVWPAGDVANATVSAEMPVLGFLDVGWTVERSATMPIG